MATVAELRQGKLARCSGCSLGYEVTGQLRDGGGCMLGMGGRGPISPALRAGM